MLQPTALLCAFLLSVLAGTLLTQIGTRTFTVHGDTTAIGSTIIDGNTNANVTIQSPENKTYNQNNVTLAFAVESDVLSIENFPYGPLFLFFRHGVVLDYNISELVNIIADPDNYSPHLPDNISTTFSSPDGHHYVGNANLTNLFEGPHNLTVWIRADYSMMSYSYYEWAILTTVSFDIDSIPPNISILSPENKAYNTAEIPLNLYINETTSQTSYILDDHAKETITGNTTLTGLADGNHSIIVYANDTAGNVGKSVANFVIDTIPPFISNISIENRAYNSTNIMLGFSVNDTVSWMGYSLDNQANATLAGNMTLSGLSEGSHNVVVYANDSAGNMGKSDTIFFTVDVTPPFISNITSYWNVFNPQQGQFTFNINEPTSWIAYSLDQQANVTITGNMTLNNLPYGLHNLTLYATDQAGNTASETIYFRVVEQIGVYLTYVTIFAVIAVGVALLVYFKKYYRKK